MNDAIRWSLDRLCQESIFLVSADHAQSVARSFGLTLDEIGIEPARADVLAVAPLSSWSPGEPTGSVRVKHGKQGEKAVWMYQLAAMLALHFGLYHDVDHALQEPWHRPQSNARYIGCRSAIRLARHFGGDDAVRELRERNPWIEPRLWSEQVYTGTGQKGERLR